MALSRQQERALVALLAAKTIEAAAKEAGCSDRAVYKWLAQPEFSARWREAREAAFGAALGAMQAASGKAVVALVAVMVKTGTSDANRIAAAKAVLEFARQASGDDLAERIAALERRAGMALNGNGKATALR